MTFDFNTPEMQAAREKFKQDHAAKQLALKNAPKKVKLKKDKPKQDNPQ